MSEGEGALQGRERQALARIEALGRGPMRRAAAWAVLSGLIWPAQAALVAWALGGLVAGQPVPGLTVALGFAALGLVRAALGYIADREAQAAAQTVVTVTRSRIVAAEAQRAEDSPFGGPGALAALAVGKAERLAPYVGRHAPALARAVVLPAVLFFCALGQSWAVAGIFLVTALAVPAGVALVGLAAREPGRRQLAEVEGLNDALAERLSALVDLRLLGARDRAVADFAARADALRRRTTGVLAVAVLSDTVLDLAAGIGIAMVAVWVGFSLLGEIGFGTWAGPLTPEAGLFLVLIAPEFYRPLRDLAAGWHDRAAALAVAGDFAAWEDSLAAPILGTGARVAPLPGPASLSLVGCLAADGTRLPEITVRAGESVALVGPRGSGKTSALRLMAGLVPPAKGRITVAGKPLGTGNADAWRARLGWMPQAPHFLNASLRRNLLMGRKGDPGPALATAGAEEVVAVLPRGLDTWPGETGGGFSDGEARRLALARAIHGLPDVILADEPTADLDPETAKWVADGLVAEARRGATLIVATNDMALANRMGRMIRLGETRGRRG